MEKWPTILCCLAAVTVNIKQDIIFHSCNFSNRFLVKTMCSFLKFEKNQLFAGLFKNISDGLRPEFSLFYITVMQAK
jgi:hypothetical protein